MFAVYILDGCYINVLYIYTCTNIYFMKKGMKLNYGKVSMPFGISLGTLMVTK